MKKLLIAVVVLAGLTAAVSAADVGKYTGSYGIGYSIPIAGTWKDAAKGSLAMSLAGDYQFQDMLSGGLELAYDFGHTNKIVEANQALFPTAGIDGGKIKILQVTPFVKYHFAKSDKIAPYGIFGLGIYNVKTAEITNTLGIAATPSVSSSKFGINLGGGAMYDIQDNLSVGLDLRWHHVFVSGGAVNNITPSVKICYMF